MRHFVGKQEVWKWVRVRLFTPGNKDSFHKKFNGAPGRAYSAAEIDELVEGYVDQIEKRFPGHEYEMVAIAPNDIRFVWRSEKKAPAIQEQRQ